MTPALFLEIQTSLHQLEKIVVWDKIKKNEKEEEEITSRCSEEDQEQENYQQSP